MAGVDVMIRRAALQTVLANSAQEHCKKGFEMRVRDDRIHKKEKYRKAHRRLTF